MLDLWGPPVRSGDPFEGEFRIALVVYPDSEILGNDTGIYGVSRLPLSLFKTAKEPSFEGTVGKLAGKFSDRVFVPRRFRFPSAR